MFSFVSRIQWISAIKENGLSDRQAKFAINYMSLVVFNFVLALAEMIHPLELPLWVNIALLVFVTHNFIAYVVCLLLLGYQPKPAQCHPCVV